MSLASSLPRVVLNAKARNTTVRYAYGWNRWKTWCKSKIGGIYIPAQPIFVALYLRHLLNSAKTIQYGHSENIATREEKFLNAIEYYYLHLMKYQPNDK